MDAIKELLVGLGLPAEALGLALVLAILLRYGRGMIPWLNSELTYLAALVFGFLGAAVIALEAGHWNVILRVGLELTAFVLIAQKLLEQVAKVVPWLPQDNQWVNK